MFSNSEISNIWQNVECQGSLDKTAQNTHLVPYQVCDADPLATSTHIPQPTQTNPKFLTDFL